MITNLTFNLTNFCITICLLYYTTNTGILFSTAVNAKLVAKPVILGILSSTSVILAFKSVFLASSLVKNFLSASLIFFSKSDLSVSYVVFKTNSVVSMLFTLANDLLYSVFLTTSFFTTSLNLLKSTGTGANLSNLVYLLQFSN